MQLVHMKTVVCALVLLFILEAFGRELIGTKQERERIMKEAISEARFSAQLQAQSEEMKRKMKTTFTAQDLLARGFKKPTKMAIQKGKARLMIEDIVHRAERKLAEMRRKNDALAASDEVKAEHLAEELIHAPGSMLTSDEIAMIFEEVEECRDTRELAVRGCNRILTVNEFRTIDGTCNNLINPLWGASDTSFGRLFDSIVYEDGVSTLRGETDSLSEETAFNAPTPSARLVSRTVIRNSPDTEDFTHLLMQFGQFLDHDLDLGPEFEVECEGCEPSEFCRPIRVENDDPTFGGDVRGLDGDEDCLPLRRSIPTCEPIPDRNLGKIQAREQINVLTSFIDGSNVYGSNANQERAVRAFNNGLLKVRPPSDPNSPPPFEALPIDEEENVACLFNANECFICGDVRCNEQVSLTIMHTLWVREHNRIARELKSLNPFWDDEKIFQEARKIVSAVLQKIVYYDYLPKILGTAGFANSIGEFTEYDDTVDPSVPNSFATAAYRYGHSLVQPEFVRLDTNYNQVGALNLAEMFFNPQLYDDQTDNGNDVMRGWVGQLSRRVDEDVNEVMTNQLFQVPRDAFRTGMDLASLNIQRGRDHGLPTYYQFREFCRGEFPLLFNEPPSFESYLTELRLEQVYGMIDNAELWPAGLAERRINGGLIGPTFACIFAFTFRDVRDGDRFYFETGLQFTTAQIAEIKKATFSSVICDNTDTTSIQPDAFENPSNSPRVPCQNIARMDLSQFQEEECFVPVTTNVDTTIGVRSRNPQMLRSKSENGISLPAGQTTCVSTLCPVREQSLDVFVFTRRQLPDRQRCPFTSPVPQTRTSTTFRMRITEADENTLFFRRFSDCRVASPVVTFDCSGSSVLIQENNDKDDDIPDDVADDIEDEINQRKHQASSQRVAEPSKLSNKQVSDKELYAELQGLLKKID